MLKKGYVNAVYLVLYNVLVCIVKKKIKQHTCKVGSKGEDLVQKRQTLQGSVLQRMAMDTHTLK